MRNKFTLESTDVQKKDDQVTLYDTIALLSPSSLPPLPFNFNYPPPPPFNFY